jgi:hypothetical protein
VARITVIDAAAATEVEGGIAHDRFMLDAAGLAHATGWQLKPEGLCRGEVCIPVRDRAALERNGSLDVAEFARLTGQVLVADPQRDVVALAHSGTRRSEALASLEAPNFTLPDIDGKPVSLSDFDRRKRLLLAWSSW